MTRDFLDFDEARRGARRRLPRGIFEYIDRGSEAETAIAHSRVVLDRFRIAPRVLSGGLTRQLGTRLFGQDLSAPLIIAPTAFAGLVRYRGEVSLARAAQAAGIPYCAATESVTSVEEARATGDGNLWFQLYLWEGEHIWKGLLDRARACGVETVAVTVDTPVPPKRIYNIRNGFGLPLSYGIRNVVDVLSHPRWAADVLGRSLLSGGLPRFAHHPRAAEASVLGRNVLPMDHELGLSWAHVARVRAHWPGNLLIKGILHPDDARLARDHGADGLVVSTHGMRNLDIALSTAEALPAIRAAAGDDMPIIADSGVQRGSDIFQLLAAGADAVMAGRAFLYGLACDGQRGAETMIALLCDELDKIMAQCGCTDVRDIARACRDLRLPGSV